MFEKKTKLSTKWLFTNIFWRIYTIISKNTIAILVGMNLSVLR